LRAVADAIDVRAVGACEADLAALGRRELEVEVHRSCGRTLVGPEDEVAVRRNDHAIQAVLRRVGERVGDRVAVERERLIVRIVDLDPVAGLAGLVVGGDRVGRHEFVDDQTAVDLGWNRRYPRVDGRTVGTGVDDDTIVVTVVVVTDDGIAAARGSQDTEQGGELRHGGPPNEPMSARLPSGSFMVGSAASMHALPAFRWKSVAGST
jgi:hypothetical protein